MMHATQGPSQIWPQDVLAFAAEQGVGTYLPGVVEMSRRVFPRAALSVMIEDDPEIANDRHIVVTVTAPDPTAAEALEARWEWHRELFACCPSTLVYHFRLGLEGLR